jgi:phosphate uptake regulator
MEQRKLLQHGASSLTLALPMPWLKERGLKKGDSLFVDKEGSKLILSTEESIKIEKISIDITKLDRTSIILYIMSLYRFGYNEIEVKFDKQTATYYREQVEIPVSAAVHKIVNRLIGAEVVEQSENRILIRYITKEAEEDFKVVLRRAFLLMNETADTLLEGIKKQDINRIRSVEEFHDNINKFVSYSLRLLNKYGYPDVKQTCFYYHIIATIDKIVDVLKYNARDLHTYNKKFNPITLSIWKQINDSIRMYYDMFYSFDLETVDKLSYNRDHVKNLITKNMRKIPHEELLFLNNMKHILEIILDLTDFRMGLEY